MLTPNEQQQAPRLTLLGLFLSLLAPLLYTLIIGPLLIRPQLDPLTYSLVGLGVMWLLAFSVLALVRYGEKLPLASIGLRRLSLKWLLLAIVLGIGLSLLVPLLTVLSSALLQGTSTDIVDTAAAFPAWILLLSVITAGVTEEVLFRGYALERLMGLGVPAWLAALTSVAAFTLTHLPGWHPVHVLGVVLPLGVLLTLLYLWRRNLLLVIVAHVMVDLPLVVMALLSP